MSFGYHTPESLLARNDSKNPSTTCKGITNVGRPCRRALAANQTDPPGTFANAVGGGVVAILDAGDAAAFFCWQHKDQAETLASKLRQRTQVVALKEKSSIDTLVERIGILELAADDQGQSRPAATPSSDGVRVAVRKRHTLPQQWQHIQGPLMSVPEDALEMQEPVKQRVKTKPVRRRQNSQRMPRSNVKASWSCCIQADDEDTPPSRLKERKYATKKPQPMIQKHGNLKPGISNTTTTSRRQISRPVVETRSQQIQINDSPKLSYPDLDELSNISPITPIRPSVKPLKSMSPPNTQTATYLSIIPPHLSPSTTSALLAELSKPISSADEEGYIYVFWLTPESEMSKPDDEIASSLMDADEAFPSPDISPTTLRSRHGRRNEVDTRVIRNGLTAKALERYASTRKTPVQAEKILLKIGRASNVHRRLSQWTKQCGQNITLIRYYPHESSSYRSKMVPHVHRVERLIHLELADQRAAGRGKCEQCGREHKEWFEVEATRAGIRAIDEVIKRWVRWAENFK